MNTSPLNDDQLAINILRGLALELPRQANSGHTGTAMALAPLGWLLYSKVLRHHPGNPNWPDRDRLVLSSGHACVLLYGLLHLCGYDLSLDDLKGFRKSLPFRTPGHPETWVTPGIDFSTGPLGQGLAAAVGMAWAEQQLSEQFGLEVIDHYTYVLCSDGDLMEGVTAEATSLAGHLRLGKLIVFYDHNSASPSTDPSAPNRSPRTWWPVIRPMAGRSSAPRTARTGRALEQAIARAKADPRPTIMCVKTVIGFPAPNLQGPSEAHSPAFPDDEIATTKQPPRAAIREALYQVTSEALFNASPSCRRARLGLARKTGILVPQRGLLGVFAKPGPCPARQLLVFLRSHSHPGGLGQSAPEPGPASVSGRFSRLGWLHPGSTNTQAGQLAFGVREGAMAAFCNGVAQHGGLIPYCSTYFAFSDQMKPALRLAALAGLGVICVWTHDSLALGEDGPTHQPVEQLASLRALPNFWVLRPADAQETEQAWTIAINAPCPVALILSRQSLPHSLPQPLVQQGFSKGGYLVSDAPNSQATFIGTGSELHLCIQARDILAQRNIAVRVVSLPLLGAI